MAVLERSYKQYQGTLTPEWSRFLIIPRHAFRNVFRSKLFTAFFALSYVCPLIFAVLIYLHHNAEALAILRIDVRQLLPINGAFFEAYMIAQGVVGGLIAMLVGPQQVSRDLTNNGLPLYLCRPFTRSEYVTGKMSIVVILLSLITWVPGEILFVFQSALEGWSWLTENIWLASAIFLSSLVFIVLMALLTQTISAWVKWLVAARAALIGFFLIPSVFSGIINEIFQTRRADLINPFRLIANVWSGLFDTFVNQTSQVQEFRNGQVVREALLNNPPLWQSWLVLFLICAACLFLLSRKVKAYEVVK